MDGVFILESPKIYQPWSGMAKYILNDEEHFWWVQDDMVFTDYTDILPGAMKFSRPIVGASKLILPDGMKSAFVLVDDIEIVIPDSMESLNCQKTSILTGNTNCKIELK